MGDVTCFKVCYSLGIKQSELRNAYPIAYRVAYDLAVFRPGKALMKFRALSAIYYLIINDFEGHSSFNSFRDKVRKNFEPMLFETGYNPIVERGRLNLIQYLNKVVVQRNSLIHEAYRQLDLGMSFECFSRLVHLRPLDQVAVDRLSFLTSKTNHIYGLYFYGEDLLNVSLGTALNDDYALWKRFCLIMGRELEPFLDTSEFASAVRNYLDNVFISVNRLMESECLVYGPCTTEVSARTMQEFLKAYGLSEISMVDEDTQSNIAVRPMCIVSDARWLAKNVTRFPDWDFAVILPIESKYYNQWRRRRHCNVYLINKNHLE